MIKYCLTYYNQEKDKRGYLMAKKQYLFLLKGREYIKEIREYSEEQVEECLKKYPPLTKPDNHFYTFLKYLSLCQCVERKELLEFFNKKDYSIYSLYKIAPKFIFELIQTYKDNCPYHYRELVDEHFILYCNLGDYIEPTYEMLEKVMNNYINLSEDKLKLLRFSEEEIIERRKLIEEINKGSSVLDSIYNFFFPKKEELKEVKIK
jgi:hypothetical protein